MSPQAHVPMLSGGPKRPRAAGPAFLVDIIPTSAANGRADQSHLDIASREAVEAAPWRSSNVKRFFFSSVFPSASATIGTSSIASFQAACGASTPPRENHRLFPAITYSKWQAKPSLEQRPRASEESASISSSKKIATSKIAKNRKSKKTIPYPCVPFRPSSKAPIQEVWRNSIQETENPKNPLLANNCQAGSAILECFKDWPPAGQNIMLDYQAPGKENCAEPEAEYFGPS